MPLLFKCKNPRTAQDALWRGLDFSTSRGLLIWSDDPLKVAGSETPAKSVLTIAEQAEAITMHYHVFEYCGRALLDTGEGLSIKSYARLLNARGEKPDFSAPTVERGWLFPNGDFVGNNNGHHADSMRFTLEMDVATAKSLGMINIQPELWFKANKEMELTEAQKMRLEQFGFNSEGKRTAVPAFTEELQRVREMYVVPRDPSTVPQYLEPEVAIEIIRNAKGELERFFNDTIGMAIHFNMSRLHGAAPEDIERIISDRNRLILNAAATRDKATNSIR